MDPNWVFAVVLRVLHIGAVVVAAGAAFFQLVALRPVLRGLPDEQHARIREQIVARWRPVVLACIALLLLSGLLTLMMFKIAEHKGQGLYHAIVGIKVLAALAVFHAATVLVLPGPKGDKARARAGFWLKYLAALFGLIIVLGAVLRNIPPANG